MRRVVLWAVALMFAASLSAQGYAVPAQAAAIPMPVDRIDDSYKIYSALMPLGETADPGWPHEQFLVEEISVSAVPATEPCFAQATKGILGGNNPHQAIAAPEARQQELNEVLDDFDKRCHERVRLEPGQWKAIAPVRLITSDEAKEFMASRFGGEHDQKVKPEVLAKFKGASAIYSFSEVYFNAHHTLAMVYATHWCGGLCGQGFWTALELRDGKWKTLPWAGMGWIA